MNPPIVSALEAARELVEFLPPETIDQLAWLETRARKVASAYIKACEALEEIAAAKIGIDVSANDAIILDHVELARAALSCSASPSEK